jgi:hypothetical protein
MAITNSKQKNGTLTLGAIAFACQATNVTITPSRSTNGDQIETLCGDVLAPASSRADALKITSVQDFNNPDGFVAYTWLQDGDQVAFSWKPSDNVDSPTFTGTVTIEACEVGGDVNTNLTTSVEWAIVGATTVTGWDA